MLKVEATHDLMVAIIIGEVILDVPSGVVHSVVPCEELITERHVLHVLACSVLDVDEGELRRVGATHIILLGECGEELVGEVARQTAVQVERERVHLVVHRVHRVGERHTIQRST